MPFRNESLKAAPGYFSLQLEGGVTAEMTTAMHTSLFRFTFPGNGSSDSHSPLILLDLTDLSNSRQDNATISVDATTGRMTGSARFLPSFGTGNYIAYFCADFHGVSSIRDSGIFVNSRASAAVHDLTISRGINGYPLPGGGWIRFPGHTAAVTARLGLSFISSEQACANAEAEIADFDFEATRTAATEAWREKMSPISVSTHGVGEDMLRNFYSGIYRTMINPQNYTGEVPGVEPGAIYFDSFYW